MNKHIAGRYKVIRSLGEGGMADVYLALDTILNREVAIKILRGELSADPVALLRFQREASAVSKLNHPNVVDVYDVGESEGHHYIVMEYVRGRTLKQLILQRGAIEKKEAVDIMLQLTSAIQHAHQNAIIHRDVKPQNVLVKDDGTIKITDFGIALAHDAVQLTQSNAILGSAHYLAPETTKGEPATNQIDVYALGIVFYELLSGSVPFTGENPVQIAMKHLRETIPSVRDFNPTLPQSIENIIIKATAKNRNLRYQSVDQMQNDLYVCLSKEHANDPKINLEKELDEETKVLSSDRRNKAVNLNAKNSKSKIRKGLVAKLTVAMILCFVLGITFVYKNQNKLLVIPNLKDKSQEEALKLLESNGFQESQIIVETQLSDTTKKGFVFKTEPEIGESISKKDKLRVFVSLGTLATIESYQGQKIENVKQEIKEKFPNAIVKIEEKATTAFEKNIIIEQLSPNVGEKMDSSKEVVFSFVVAKTPMVKIENVIGLSVEEAKRQLDSYGVAVVTIKKSVIGMSEDEIKNLKKGVVVEVDPKEGSVFVQDGTTNYITLYYY